MCSLPERTNGADDAVLWIVPRGAAIEEQVQIQSYVGLAFALLVLSFDSRLLDEVQLGEFTLYQLKTLFNVPNLLNNTE